MSFWRFSIILVTSDYIYRNYPELHEGRNDRTRAAVVCEASLMRCAERIGLEVPLPWKKGKHRREDSLIHTVRRVEALIGAIYIDGGISAARRFILRYMEDIYQDIDRQNNSGTTRQCSRK